MSKFRTTVRPKVTIRTRRTPPVRVIAIYDDRTMETFVADERGRFRLRSIVCGGARHVAGER